jgi:O-antigen/teichoic acid export membrane protein
VSSPATEPKADDGHATASAQDVGATLRNGAKLGGSLLATWTVAIVLRFLLPRWLGPERFGEYTFADMFAGAYFAFVGLGVDTYISKVLPVRKEHASDFFGSVLLLRLVLSAGLIAALVGTLIVSHRPSGLVSVVLVFGLSQLLVSVNGTLASMLQACSTVSGLALVNVTSKVIWGVGTIGALVLGSPLVGLAAVLFVSELVKAIVLFRLVRAVYRVPLRLDAAALKVVLVASFPFYANGVVITLNQKTDITLLEFLTNDDVQVGWYGAAQTVTGLAFVLSPVLLWVVTPLMSRAVARSKDEMFSIVRRAIEGVYVVTLPLVLVDVLGADVWVRLLFGKAYAPAAMAVRTLAPVFLLTYLAMLLSMTLVVLDRGWRLTLVSALGLATNVVLTILLVPIGAHLLGPGGAGVGDALAVVLMEMLVSTVLLATIGREAVDRRMLGVLARSAFPIAACVGVHLLARGLGPARLGLDVVVYVVVAFVARVPGIDDVRTMIRLFRTRRSGAA